MKVSDGWVSAQVHSPGIHGLHHSLLFLPRCHLLQTVPTSMLAPMCHLLVSTVTRYLTCPLSKNTMMTEETSAKPLLQKQFILKMTISIPRMILEHLKSYYNILKHKILNLLICNSVSFYLNGLEPTKRKQKPNKCKTNSGGEGMSIQNIRILNYF